MRNNKGFSLVELIIVLAIMAVLVGVIAPMLIKYVEKSRVSADIQLCDAIHDAIVYTAANDSLKDAPDCSHVYCELFWIPNRTGTLLASDSGYANSAFAEDVKDIIGFNPFAETGNEYMKSNQAHASGQLKFLVNSSGSDFIIYIDNSDNTAGRGSYTYASDPDKVICNGLDY